MLKDFIIDQEYLKAALLGTIMADGYIGKARVVKGHKNPAYQHKAPFEVTHTSKNLDYLKEVKTLIEMLPDTKCTIRQHNKVIKDKDKKRYTKDKYFLYRLSTNSTRFFAQIRDKIYYFKNGARYKKFPKNIIYQMNDMALLLLYLDDGTLRVRYRDNGIDFREFRVTFCLNSFTLQELKDFAEFLKSKYDIESHYYKFSRNMEENRGYVLWLNTTNTKKFMEIINKFYDFVPSMQYKFVKYYLS